jgi:hypothetical protein
MKKVIIAYIIFQIFKLIYSSISIIIISHVINFKFLYYFNFYDLEFYFPVFYFGEYNFRLLAIMFSHFVLSSILFSNYIYILQYIFLIAILLLFNDIVNLFLKSEDLPFVISLMVYLFKLFYNWIVLMGFLPIVIKVSKFYEKFK